MNFSDVLDAEELAAPPQDSTPVFDTSGTCEFAGCDEIKTEYAGRGRKPRFCTEHTNLRKKPGAAEAAARKAPNQKLADQATEVLLQLNGFLAIALRFGKLEFTASALAECQEEFRVKTNAALLTDPDLCRTILRAGTTSGKMGLAVAYGMLAGAVAPIAIMEIRERRNENRA